MRKFIISIIFIMVLITPISFSSALHDIDLFSLSYYELIALRNSIDALIWGSDEWKQATVPAGVYIVGEDIPAGKWTINMIDSQSAYSVCAFAVYGSPDDFYNSNGCVSNAFLQVGTPYTANIIDGQLVNITGESVTFQPYTGSTIRFK